MGLASSGKIVATFRHTYAAPPHPPPPGTPLVLVCVGYFGSISGSPNPSPSLHPQNIAIGINKDFLVFGDQVPFRYTVGRQIDTPACLAVESASAVFVVVCATSVMRHLHYAQCPTLARASAQLAQRPGAPKGDPTCHIHTLPPGTTATPKVPWGAPFP
uniref:Uncharacterized protein n=1 Tax=Eutreptiella gymnastica TaxID=73025 RepID=A0A7S4LJS3_9EUGL